MNYTQTKFQEFLFIFKRDIHVQKMLAKNKKNSIPSLPTLWYLGLFQYDLYHWIGYLIGYFMTYGKGIVDKEQIHREHLTATVAKQPLSPVVYP